MKQILISLAILTLATPIAHSDLHETRATLREHVLQLINRDRQHYGLPPVELDVQASAFADEYCRTQIRNGTTGHFTTDGLAPYARWSMAGGTDAVSENAAAWSAAYRFDERALFEMVRRSQDAMMAETPPDDGHKRTMLDPHATHVGIGLAWERGEFRLIQEFLRRYIVWEHPLPRAAQPGQSVTVAGRTPEGWKVEGMTVHHERLPQRMSAAAASAISTYSLPERRREYTPGPAQRRAGMLAAMRRSELALAEDGTFSFAASFLDGPGLYTIVAWVRRDGDATPFPASNITIRVEEAQQSAAGRSEVLPSPQ